MAINLEDHELETQLRHELQGVADRVTVPPMPDLSGAASGTGSSDGDQTTSRGWWNPSYLAVAAVAALIVGLVATLSMVRDDDGDSRPAPAGPNDPTSAPTSAPSAPADVSEIPTTVPMLPHINGTALVVDGKTIPGRWYNVQGGPQGWLALRYDGTWWAGTGSNAQPMENVNTDDPPGISPSGEYVAYVTTEQDKDLLTGFVNGASGEGLGAIPIELGNQDLGTRTRVTAVTDDGKVIALGVETATLWTPLTVGSKPIDMTTSLQGKTLMGATSRGLMVNTSEDSRDILDAEYYLARLADDGELEKVRDLPSHDDLTLSPNGTRMVWSKWGTTVGDVLGLPAYQKGTEADGRTGTVRAPKGWVMSQPYGWEDDEFFITQLSRGVVEGDVENRLGRCSFTLGRCAFITMER